MNGTIPDDILDVAAVVLGEQRINLTGWQRTHAIAAMTALGHSTRHIAWMLGLTRQAANDYARKHGIHLHAVDQRLDWTAINMVVTGQARIHLIGADREEAIRLMAPRLNTDEIGARLAVGDSHEVRRIAARIGVTLTEADQWNWYAYLRRWAQNEHRSAVAA